ncbi:centrosomal protein of 78 kDa-like [Polistes fuscatus]|uniref:centrosomal protein of 78 kDa-like n=1 Tax=Polistes fuscatus TaxID=30207 RepID=UPI001CA8B459|nr:centrosomal protein of 78 kDa-like [Polistes fuscatus]XP_043501420.1 centrosomal protein of 78 kDa-like [Polistes fuscatus]
MVEMSGTLLASSPRSTRGETASRRKRKKNEISSTIVNTKDTTIPTGKNFTACYMELCKRYHLRPLPIICVTLPYSLDFTTDRIKMEDWRPILNSLSLDRSSLRSISIRSRYQYRKPSENGDGRINLEEKNRSKKGPGVLTQCLLEWLSHSIGQCVRNSLSLTHLELEGIPFPTDCLAVLCVGLAGTETLEHLSFQRCYIGDAGCELVCRAITDVRTIRSLNFSDCDLTSRCGTVLASTLSRQELSLYHETWKQSLRYRQPNIEAMPGLRRLTLSDNPRLGDSVVLKMIEVIRDSLWLKALDLRHCGLTDQIGNDLLELLEQNSSLTVLDVRQNSNMNDNLIEMILQRLDGKERHGDYDWSNSSRKDCKLSSMNFQRIKSNKGNNNKENEINGAYEKKTNRIRENNSIGGKKTKVLTPSTMKTRKDNTQPSELNKVQGRLVKPSLHLDLQSRIKPTTVEMTTTNSLETSESNVKFSSGNKLEKKNEDREQIIMMTRELMLARTTHDHLLEENKRQDILVAREKAKREIAETKLRAMSTDLADLENILREKDRETDGFLLVSQRSLNDICASFDRLVELLESLTRNSRLDRKHLEENLTIGKDVKRRFIDSIVRKTKSENLGRGYVVDIEDDEREEEEEKEREEETIEKDKEMIVESSRFDKKKLVKSEGDVRRKQQQQQQPLPLTPVRVETNIGDNPDVLVVGSSLKGLVHGRLDAGDKRNMSSVERAKNIFFRFVNGEVEGNFPIG